MSVNYVIYKAEGAMIDSREFDIEPDNVQEAANKICDFFRFIGQDQDLIRCHCTYRKCTTLTLMKGKIKFVIDACGPFPSEKDEQLSLEEQSGNLSVTKKKSYTDGVTSHKKITTKTQLAFLRSGFSLMMQSYRGCFTITQKPVSKL